MLSKLSVLYVRTTRFFLLMKVGEGAEEAKNSGRLDIFYVHKSSAIFCPVENCGVSPQLFVTWFINFKGLLIYLKHKNHIRDKKIVLEERKNGYYGNPEKDKSKLNWSK